MSITVFNTRKRQPEQFMFFGEEPNISRYDVMAQPIFHKLTEKQKGFFWQPSEIDLTKDSKDFKMLSDVQKHIFTKTLSYQTMLDSVQGRSPALALLPHCSLPELEACINWWCAMEQMHNESYSHIIRNVYQTPADVFDTIILDENIINRAKTTIKYYDSFIKASCFYRSIGGHSGNTNDDNENFALRDLKKKLILCIASINALEGLSFYASFACSFAFAEQGLMVGNATIISLIARDENLHLAITQNIMKKWSNGQDDPEMQTLYAECLDEIRDIYMNIIEQEKEWCKYLFRDGSMIGLNERILSDYVEYMAGKRMKNIGLKTDFITKNPLSWTDKYLNSHDAQEAPQEIEKQSYIIGGTKNDVADADFSDLSF